MMRSPPPTPPSLKNVNFLIYWLILMKFDFFEGGGEGEEGSEGPFIINFYLNYYW